VASQKAISTGRQRICASRWRCGSLRVDAIA
jgi:hypothetical protein